LDVEASGFDGYPIEVAVTDEAGGVASWLIRRHHRWATWEWSMEAEGIHGISRDLLEVEGLPVEVVARELTECIEACVVAGGGVFSDNSVYDGWMPSGWLWSLFEAAGVPPPAAALEDISRLWWEAGRPLLEGLPEDWMPGADVAWERAEAMLAGIIKREVERGKARHRHRAGEDVRSHLETWKEIRLAAEGVAKRR
jgi:hypothetical protein